MHGITGLGPEINAGMMALELAVEKPPGTVGAVHLSRHGDLESPLPQPRTAAGRVNVFQLFLFAFDAFELLWARPDVARVDPQGLLAVHARTDLKMHVPTV